MRRVFAYLKRLPRTTLERRKARIPPLKQYMGTDEIPLGRYVGAMFDFHWKDHAGQLARIRKAAACLTRDDSPKRLHRQARRR